MEEGEDLAEKTWWNCWNLPWNLSKAVILNPGYRLEDPELFEAQMD